MTRLLKKMTLLCGALALFACSNANSNNGATALVDSSGNHPSDWLEKHWTVAGSLAGKNAADAASAGAAAKLPCLECHGSDLLGGISKVSCFNSQGPVGQQCDATTLGHPEGWRRAIQHGQAGAMASAGVSSGFLYCSKCHGSDYRGGTGSAAAAVSCFSCHTTAPHPPAPWIGGNVSHATSSPTDAAACFPCHAGGRNFGAVLVSAPLPTSPAAPTPDCFNNTLCHGGQVNPPHAAGAAYLNLAQHGIDATGNNAAKPELSLSACRACHAGATGRFNLQTNNMASGCETCHSPFTAHPVPWLPGRAGAGATPRNPNTTSHATVSATNLGTDCVLCHGAALDGVAGKGGAPSCLSGSVIFGTSCHASSPGSHTGCTSCHSGFVNRQPTTGSHGVHLALPNVSCDACHSGGGADPLTRMGGALHANGFLNVSSAGYWGRNGGFRFDGDTCSNVRCHGGQTTPSWGDAGSLEVNRDCLKCHEQGNAGNAPQTPQFNSFYSGSFTQAFTPVNLHQFHLDPNNRLLFPNLPVFCTDCHTLTTRQHFGGLADIGFQSTPGNSPGDTIHIPGVYLKDLVTGTYPGTCSNVACHTIAPSTASWGK